MGRYLGIAKVVPKSLRRVDPTYQKMLTLYAEKNEFNGGTPLSVTDIRITLDSF